MFEKESQDYAARETAPRQELYIKGRADINADYEDVKRIWREGAEFAYNKANEWHYPSKGEYPEENLECLCIDKVWTEQTFTTILKCCDGVFIDSNGTPYDVIAWKEIVLPELKESE